MNLLKEYIREVIKAYLFEEVSITSVSTTTAGSTTGSTSSRGTTSTTGASSTSTTGTRRSEDDPIEDVENRIANNEKEISNIKKDSTNLSNRTREIQASNNNMQSNIRQAADSTEKLRDARDADEVRNAYTNTAQALRAVATDVGNIAQQQAGVSDIYNKQGSRRGGQ